MTVKTMTNNWPFWYYSYLPTIYPLYNKVTLFKKSTSMLTFQTQSLKFIKLSMILVRNCTPHTQLLSTLILLHFSFYVQYLYLPPFVTLSSLTTQSSAHSHHSNVLLWYSLWVLTNMYYPPLPLEFSHKLNKHFDHSCILSTWTTVR